MLKVPIRDLSEFSAEAQAKDWHAVLKLQRAEHERLEYAPIIARLPGSGPICESEYVNVPGAHGLSITAAAIVER